MRPMRPSTCACKYRFYVLYDRRWQNAPQVSVDGVKIDRYRFYAALFREAVIKVLHEAIQSLSLKTAEVNMN